MELSMHTFMSRIFVIAVAEFIEQLSIIHASFAKQLQETTAEYQERSRRLQDKRWAYVPSANQHASPKLMEEYENILFRVQCLSWELIHVVSHL